MNLANIFAAHKAAIEQAKAKPAGAPGDIETCLAAFERFQTAAFK
jgi:hypothetical protein